MSLFDGIRKLFSPKKAGGSACNVCVVDGVTLVNARGGRSNPREVLGLLSRLARFATREGFTVRVVLEGEPLHRAPDGEDFQGIAVQYEKDSEARKQALLRIAKKMGGIVVTQDPEVTRFVLAAGVEVLRCSTFRKAMDSDGNGGVPIGDRGPDRSRPQGRNRNRNPRRNNDRRPGPAEGASGEGSNSDTSGSEPGEPRESSGDTDSRPSAPSAVRDLVDLVE